MASEEKNPDIKIAPWLGTAKQKKAYEAEMRELENFLTKEAQMTKGTHYTMHNMLMSAVSDTKKLGEWVYISFITIRKQKQDAENLKMLFQTRVHGKLKTEDPNHPKYTNVAIFVKLNDYSLNNEAIVVPSRAGDFEDEILKLQKTRTEELTEIFYLLHLPIVPNKDQYNLEENWLSCNQKDDGDVEKNVKILTSIGLLAARRIDNSIPGNISVGLNDDIPSVLQILKTKPSISPEILLGDEACENAKWIIEKFFRDVKFETPKEEREIGLTSKWAVEKKVDEIVKALCHYGVMAISCDSKKSPNLVILQTKRAVYEFCKSGEGVSYTELVDTLRALGTSKRLDELLPADFTSVVPFNFKNISAGAIQIRISRKKNKNDAEVYDLIQKNLGIPAYNQNSSHLKSVKITSGKAPNLEGKDYKIIQVLKDEKNSTTDKDIIDTLNADGYLARFIGDKEGGRASSKTICFYPKKEKETILQNPEPAVVLEKSAGETEVKQVEEPKLVLSTVEVLIPIVEAIFSQLKPEQIKMLVTLIPALKPETPEPVIVDKTVDNVDKLMLVYKFVPAEKSESINPNIFASKGQILKLILSEDSTA